MTLVWNEDAVRAWRHVPLWFDSTDSDDGKSRFFQFGKKHAVCSCHLVFYQPAFQRHADGAVDVLQRAFPSLQTDAFCSWFRSGEYIGVNAWKCLKKFAEERFFLASRQNSQDVCAEYLAGLEGFSHGHPIFQFMVVQVMDRHGKMKVTASTKSNFGSLVPSPPQALAIALQRFSLYVRLPTVFIQKRLRACRHNLY